MVDGLLAQSNYLGVIDSAFVNNPSPSSSGFMDAAAQATSAVLSKIGDILPIIFPALGDPAALLGIAAGAALSYGLAFVPVAGAVVDLVDEGIGFVADAQNVVDLTETLGESGTVHTFAPLDSLRQTGSTNVAPLFQLAIPRSTAGALSALGNPDEIVPLTATVVVGADSESTSTYTIAPADQVANSEVGLFNLAQFQEGHFGASGTAAVPTPVSLFPAPVPFDVMEAKLPIGQGPVSFASSPTVGRQVRIRYLGEGVSLVDTAEATVAATIPLTNNNGDRVPVAMQLQLASGSNPPKALRQAGGLVYDDSGPNAGQLVGLVEDSVDGQYTALTGIGATYLFCQAEGKLCS